MLTLILALYDAILQLCPSHAALIKSKTIDPGLAATTQCPNRRANRKEPVSATPILSRECTRFRQASALHPSPLLAMHRTFLTAPSCACRGVAHANPPKRHLSSPLCAGEAEREKSKVKTQQRVAWSTRTALKSEKLKPKRSLGQNFLQREEVLRAIVAAAELQSGDRVLEIGPGTGNLTRYLLKTGARVTAVEKDDALYAALLEQFDQVAAGGRIAQLQHKWHLARPEVTTPNLFQLLGFAIPDISKYHGLPACRKYRGRSCGWSTAMSLTCPLSSCCRRLTIARTSAR